MASRLITAGVRAKRLLHLGSCLVTCSVFYSVWMQQHSKKSNILLTSAHSDEWDNKMQNQSRTQALFACLRQALSEDKVPSLRKLLSRF